MTNAKHTPGPWRLIEPNEKIHWPIVQRKDTGGFIVMTEDVDVSCADARLIAAAPELLEALKAIVPVVINRILEPSSDQSLKDVILGACDAIAKAEGAR